MKTLRTQRSVNRWALLAACLFLALLLGACGRIVGRNPSEQVPDGDALRGRRMIVVYGCHSCHTIPGIREAKATVGPPLTDWADRHYIAGALSNTPENLILWIQDPQAIEPGTAMPNMGVTNQDARDVAAYLFTLRRRSLFQFPGFDGD
jgi:cytochrome c